MEGHRARFILLAGVALGVAWYGIGKYIPSRLDIALSAAMLLLVLVALERRGIFRLPAPDRAFLGVPAALLAVSILWHDSEALFAVNTIALAGLLVLATRGSSRVPVLQAQLLDLFEQGAVLVAGCAGGAIPVATASMSGSRMPGRTQFGFGVGVVAVSPLLVIFALLLGNADKALLRLLEGIVDINLEPVLEHAIPIVLLSWLALGVLWALCRSPRPLPRPLSTGGFVAPSIVVGGLSALALLFSTFLVLQSRYLFGGRAVVLAGDLSFSAYARQGFFELVTVCTCMLPVLLVADWVARRVDEASTRRLARTMRFMLFLLAGLSASALMRMLVYTAEMGLTELRLYTTAFMMWLGFVLLWFGRTVVRGRRHLFTGGALGSAMLVLLALNLLNPVSLIAGYNLDRAAKGHELDVNHIVDLGGAAVPVVLDRLGELPVATRCPLVRELAVRWVTGEDGLKRWTIEGERAMRLQARLRAESNQCSNWGVSENRRT